MKKICVAACMLCFLCLHIPRGAVSLPFEGRYSFYVTEAVFPDGCDVTNAGIFYIITCDFSDAPPVRERRGGGGGESVPSAGAEKDFPAAVETMGRTLFRGTAGGAAVVEGYAEGLPYGVTVKGKAVNFQAAFDGENITVGTPLIMGGY